MRTETYPNRLLLILLTAGVLPAMSCAAQVAAPQASYPPQVTMALKGTRCSSATSCTCRPLDSDDDQAEEDIPPGHKRFEFRLPRTTSAIWVEVEGKGVFYKPPQRVPPQCFYVDLTPGGHRVTVHSEVGDQEVGLQTGLAINEYGAKVGHSWYRSFDFVCGGLNKCTKAGIQAWRGFQAKLPRGVLDPCGSTMIQGVSFGGTRAQHLDTEYTDLTLKLTVKVYEFEPYRSPGSPECKAPVKNR